MPEQETVVTPQPPKPETEEQQNQENKRRVWTTLFWVISGILLLLWLLGLSLRRGGWCIHLLLIPMLLGLLIEFALRRAKPWDIQSEQSDVPKWDPTKPDQSLSGVFSYVVKEAGKSSNWYWRAKKWKSRSSQVIRFLAWVLAAVGGLLPIAVELFKDFLPPYMGKGLWASFLLGLAAALLGLDKAFGYSSGWARYVLTATNIRKTLEEFRLDWVKLMATTGTSPTTQQIAMLMERAGKFRVDVESLVLQETKDWVSEFQNTMAQMEKDVAAQLATLKVQVDKTIAAREEALHPGSIQLSLQNVAKATAGTLRLSLTDSNGKSIEEAELKGASWAKILAPGAYHLRVEWTANNQSSQEEKVITVKAGTTENVQIAL